MTKYPEGFSGCSDGNCLFVKNTGMVTNGGCSCERELRRTPEGQQAFRMIVLLRREMDKHTCSSDDFEPMRHFRD